MTQEEERMLKGYLRKGGTAFEQWRDSHENDEAQYKTTLAEARAWHRGVLQGAAAVSDDVTKFLKVIGMAPDLPPNPPTSLGV